VNVVPHDGYWLDIGRPEDFEVANREFEKDRNRFL
jgi:NDP-sugar pyrophosphorylase family protein